MSTGHAPLANIVDGGLTGCSETELSINTFNTVGGVDVLDKCELEAGSASLARGDSRVGQEVFPDLEEISHFPTILIASKHLKLTLYHLLPYLASTFSRLANQLRYQRQIVAE